MVTFANNLKESKTKTSNIETFNSGENTLKHDYIEGVYHSRGLENSSDYIEAYCLQLVSLSFIKEPYSIEWGLFAIGEGQEIREYYYKDKGIEWAIGEAKKEADVKWNKLKERKEVATKVFEDLKDEELLKKINSLYNNNSGYGYWSSRPICYFSELNLLPEQQKEVDKIGEANRMASTRIKDLERVLNHIKSVQEIKDMDVSKVENAISDYKNSIKQIPYGRKSDKKIAKEVIGLVASRILAVISGMELGKEERAYWGQVAKQAYLF